jgi:DNA-directed RNA polymerase specialized sigma24 family protein
MVMGSMTGRAGADDPVDHLERAGELFASLEPHLRPALLAYAGSQAVDDAVGDTLVYLCENAERILAMESPRGYLFRVARDRARGSRRKPVTLPLPSADELPTIEPALAPALMRLPRNQRVCVFLVTGLRWRWVEVAEFLGIGVSSVRNHHRRGMAKLRSELGEDQR